MKSDSIDGAQKGDKPSSFIGVLGFVFLLFILTSIIVPSFLSRSRNRSGQFVACQSNLKNIGTALEMYSTDNSGHYPAYMRKLTPTYLKTLPSCPSAGTDMVYTNSYRTSTTPDAYSFYCSGYNHGANRVPANFPQYDSYKGITVRP